MSNRILARSLRAMAVLGSVMAVSVPATQTVSAVPAPARAVHYMLPNRQTATAAPAAVAAQPPLTYITAGAPIMSAPKLYLVFWGIQWNVGWKDVGPSVSYTSGTAKNYIINMAKYLTVSPYLNSTKQYCSGVPVGTVNCGTAGLHVGQLTFGGSWVDTTSVPPPTPYTPDGCLDLVVCFGGSGGDQLNQVGQEAIRAQQHFLGSGYSANALYMIMLPKEATTAGSYCAYHNSIPDAKGRVVAYTNMPYTPDLQLDADGLLQTSLCGMNFVNKTDNTFGNGYLDGYGMVFGHEIAEALTDAQPVAKRAWGDSNGQENGDKCQWLTPGGPGGAHNIGPDSHGHVYAVQTLWSNVDSDCVG